MGSGVCVGVGVGSGVGNSVRSGEGSGVGSKVSFASVPTGAVVNEIPMQPSFFTDVV